MPGLRWFGKQWKIGSDDFVFPGIVETIFRVAWLTAIATILHVYKHAFSCPGGDTLWLYHIGVLTFISSGIIITLAMTIVSAQGSITYSRPRRSIPLILYLKVALTVPEIGWNCLGTYWAFRESTGCDWSVVATVKGAVIFAWIISILLFVGMLILLDPIGHNDTDLTDHVDSSLFLTSTRSSARRIWENRCRLLCCCARLDKNHSQAFTDVAQLITDFFHSVDLVPTDIAAGFLLIHKQQEILHSSLCTVITHDDITISGATNQPNTRNGNIQTDQNYTDDIGQYRDENISNPSNMDDNLSCLKEISPSLNADLLANEIPRLDIGRRSGLPTIPPKPWMNIENLAFYMKYAIASYGWPMYMYMNLCTGMCRLYGECRCCSCETTPDNTHDNACYCNTAALRKITGLADDDLIYISYHNSIYEVPFFVALDRQNQNVVVAIRGTLSLRDALTDMTADCDALDIDGIANSYAHKGIHSAATYVSNTLQQKHILDRAFSLQPGYNLVITGHSLGAGAASILGILLRPLYPNLKCFTYSPPGGLLSANAAVYSQEFTCSVIVGKDLVPRLGLPTMNDLKNRLVRTLHSCSTPKYKILFGGCCEAACGYNPVNCHMTSPADDRDAVRQPLLGESHNSQYSTVQEALLDARITTNQSNTSTPKLLPPGLIVHITRMKRPKRVRGVQYTANWSTADKFNEIIISPKMVADHFPDVVLESLQSLASKNFTLSTTRTSNTDPQV